jgi:hypothetical protein
MICRSPRRPNDENKLRAAVGLDCCQGGGADLTFATTHHDYLMRTREIATLAPFLPIEQRWFLAERFRDLADAVERVEFTHPPTLPKRQ